MVCPLAQLGGAGELLFGVAHGSCCGIAQLLGLGDAFVEFGCALLFFLVGLFEFWLLCKQVFHLLTQCGDAGFECCALLEALLCCFEHDLCAVLFLGCCLSVLGGFFCFGEVCAGLFEFFTNTGYALGGVVAYGFCFAHPIDVVFYAVNVALCLRIALFCCGEVRFCLFVFAGWFGCFFTKVAAVFFCDGVHEGGVVPRHLGGVAVVEVVGGAGGAKCCTQAGDSCGINAFVDGSLADEQCTEQGGVDVFGEDVFEALFGFAAGEVFHGGRQDA